jgi:LIM domain
VALVFNSVLDILTAVLAELKFVLASNVNVNFSRFFQILTITKLDTVCLLTEEFIVGRVIKAMNANWHPHCFLCELCDAPLADAGFIKSAGRSVLKEIIQI